MGNELLPSRPSKVILYTTADGRVTVDVFFLGDNFWLSQRTMAELFGVRTAAVSRHLKNIYASGELSREATVSKMETVQTEGGRGIVREIDFYNLDAVIATECARIGSTSRISTGPLPGT